MSIADSIVEQWKAEVSDLRRRNELLESGKMRKGETRVEASGGTTSADTTKLSIERNNKRIAELEARIAARADG